MHQQINVRARQLASYTAQNLSEIVRVVDTSREHSIYHKDLLPVVYVTGDMAGETDSPLYGLFEIAGKAEAATGISPSMPSTAPWKVIDRP